MQYTFKPRALKQLEKLPKKIQKRIINKLDFYVSQKEPTAFSETLTDLRLGSHRFRIGDYRVVFDVEKNYIIVLLVGHRKEIYR